jgi:hypothetical protein
MLRELPAAASGPGSAPAADRSEGVVSAPLVGGSGVGGADPVAPIGTEVSDSVASRSIAELTAEGRRLAVDIAALLAEAAERLAADGRALLAGRSPRPGSRRGKRDLVDAASLLWGIVAASAMFLSGLGLAWVTGSRLWLLPALLLGVAAMVVAYRSAVAPPLLDDFVVGEPPGGNLRAGGPAPSGSLAAMAATRSGAEAVPSRPVTTWPTREVTAVPPGATGRRGASPPGDPAEAWRNRLQVLQLAVDRAEAATLDWPRLGVAVAPHDARPGDLVIPAELGRWRAVIVDEHWLPEDLRPLAGPLGDSDAASAPEAPTPAPAHDLTRSEPSPGTGARTGGGDGVAGASTSTAGGVARGPAWALPPLQRLHRVLADDGETVHVARWAAYFPPRPGPPMSLTNAGGDPGRPPSGPPGSPAADSRRSARHVAGYRLGPP